jgi:hypothetical protein
VNEGTLKAKWTRHARKAGFRVKALSPHQIPGLPDLIVVDKACSVVVRGLFRCRQHWVEAKVAKAGPFVFKAERDATGKQADWQLSFRIMGVPTWWLILAPDKWALIPGDQLEMTKQQFAAKARPYGRRISELCEPEIERHVLAKKTDALLEKAGAVVARLFKKKAKKK